MEAIGSGKMKPDTVSTESIFIAGGTGFVGSALIEKCKQANLKYFCLTRKTELSADNVFVGDLLVPSQVLSTCITSANTFINCSGELSDIKKMRALHVDGTQNLLTLLAQSRNSNKVLFHWIQLSSCGAYGHGRSATKPVYIDEFTETNPSGDYERTKVEADNLLISFAEQHNWFKYTIIRPTIVFGPGMRSTAILRIAKMIKNRLFFYVGNRDSIANYVHVGDVVEAMLLSINQQKAYNQLFIVSNDCKFSDLIDAIASAFNVPKPRWTVNEFLLRKFVSTIGRWVKLPLSNVNIDVMMRRTHYSSEKIRKLLNWEPNALVSSQLGEYIDSNYYVKNG
jgi:nucleoside-diphosphate-sugar epimerase